MRHVVLILTLVLSVSPACSGSDTLAIHDGEYFEMRGLNVMVFSNRYNANFGDSKMSGVELIHHGVRTATNGDVRLAPTPGQWDQLPLFDKRVVRRESQTIDALLSYPSYHFDYTLRVTSHEDRFTLEVDLASPLPGSLEGRAGLNIEFLPSAYFGKTFLFDGKPGLFPLAPTGPMSFNEKGVAEPLPFSTGRSLTLAPEDPERCVSIDGGGSELFLYDGRNTAQNGWYVVRSLIPAGRTGTVISWTIAPHTIEGWIRPPVIEHSQVGYHPSQAKRALIELDRNDMPLSEARLFRIEPSGDQVEAFRGATRPKGQYLRYNYLAFDFSSVRQSGVYVIGYGKFRSTPFRIAPDVYADAWHASLDVYLPEQMDHVRVREAYRIWHGASHLDDALQAPVNHEHFDLYAQGPTTDSPFHPGEHIPGLNVGGWFDAGDFDIRTQTQYAVILGLAELWEEFRPARDETTIDERNRSVEIHRPDGKPDVLQQIEHGVLQLLAQQKAVGHAINGIIAAHLYQYTHLGDASTKTDNLIYNPGLDSTQTDGCASGRFDDRWAFTSRSSALNYGSAAALAAASRALAGFDDSLAHTCFSVALKIWDDEQSHPPDMFRNGNTTGGRLDDERLKAAVELLICTRENRFVRAVAGLLPDIEERFLFSAIPAARALPYMDSSYHDAIRRCVQKYRATMDSLRYRNPFGVPISTGGWAGSGLVVGFALTNSVLSTAFPALIDGESVLQGLNYLYGCHPGSAISFVSGVGTESKRIAYGNNRADYSFIPGGVVPGVLILPPDFPENKEDWPFLWGENEYVVSLAVNYVYLVHAAQHVVSQPGF
jgi:endoglucanase